MKVSHIVNWYGYQDSHTKSQAIIIQEEMKQQQEISMWYLSTKAIKINKKQQHILQHIQVQQQEQIQE